MEEELKHCKSLIVGVGGGRGGEGGIMCRLLGERESALALRN